MLRSMPAMLAEIFSFSLMARKSVFKVSLRKQKHRFWREIKAFANWKTFFWPKDVTPIFFPPPKSWSFSIYSHPSSFHIRTLASRSGMGKRVGCDCSYTTKASIERLLAFLQVPVGVGGMTNRLFSVFSVCQLESSMFAQQTIRSARNRCIWTRFEWQAMINHLAVHKIIVNEWVKSELLLASYFKRPFDTLLIFLFTECQ